MKTNYTPAPNAPAVPTNSVFTIGEIADRSGFEPPADEDETIDLKLAMTAALRKALTEKGAFAEQESQWTVAVEIISYAPGNAFARWLFPGAGATKLSVVAYVLDDSGQQAAKLLVERSIGFGGAYTVGAWKYVFDEVAREIVETLTDPKKRVGLDFLIVSGC
jgi:hypothetical protein